MLMNSLKRKNHSRESLIEIFCCKIEFPINRDSAVAVRSSFLPLVELFHHRMQCSSASSAESTNTNFELFPPLLSPLVGGFGNKGNFHFSLQIPVLPPSLSLSRE
jgi:hypothetical protein